MSNKKSAASLFGRTGRKFSPANDKVEWVLPDQSVGIEIEIEYSRGIVWPETVWPYWTETRDGSLRNGKEYVLAMPMKGAALSKAIGDLFHSGKWGRSTTGSTHIHLDMMEEETTVEMVKVLVLMVYALEDAVFRYLGAGREWCGYTNKLCTAPEQLIAAVLNSGEEDNYRQLYVICHGGSDGNIGRYYGLNLMALHKYGSIEFRYFPTAVNKEELIDWVQLMMSFKKAAVEVGTIEQLLAIFSNEDAYQRFLASYFPTWSDKFSSYVPYYRAIASIKKALTIAAANKQPEEEPYTFNPDAITANPVLRRFATTAGIAEEPIPPAVIVSYNSDAPASDVYPQYTVLVYNGAYYMLFNHTWRSIDDMAFGNNVPAKVMFVKALRKLAGEINSSLLASTYGYTPTSAGRCVNSLTHGITVLERQTGMSSNNYDDTAPYSPPRRVVERDEFGDPIEEEDVFYETDPDYPEPETSGPTITWGSVHNNPPAEPARPSGTVTLSTEAIDAATYVNLLQGSVPRNHHSDINEIMQRYMASYHPTTLSDEGDTF